MHTERLCLCVSNCLLYTHARACVYAFMWERVCVNKFNDQMSSPSKANFSVLVRAHVCVIMKENKHVRFSVFLQARAHVSMSVS